MDRSTNQEDESPSRMAGSPSRIAARLPAPLAALLLALLSALLIADRASLIQTHLSTDPNEGWNAFQAARAMAGAVLYPPPGSLTGNNYPPLSFYIVGLAGRLTGDVIIAGRIVALLAMLATGGLVMLIARRLAPQAAGSRAPWLALLLFGGLCATLLRRYIALDDPQWLAHAVMTAGLLLILPRAPSGKPAAAAVAGAALLMLTGGMVKHNLLAAPVAVTLWLALHHRAALRIWCLTAGAALLAAAGACLALYGGDIFRDIGAAQRHMAWARMAAVSAVPLLALLPLAAVSLPLKRRRHGDTRLDLPLLYAAIALPLGLFQRSGQGVDVNAHIEAAIALSITAALGIEALRRPGVIRPGVIQIAAMLPLLVIGAATLPKVIAERHDLPAQLRDWRETEAAIAAAPGPAACQMPALCFWAGKEFALDFFLYGQIAALSGDTRALTEALDRHAFAVIALEPPRRRLTAGEVANPLPALIAARYRVSAVSPEGRQLLAP